MTTRTIVVVSAGLSVPSSTRVLADQLADATRRRLLDESPEVTVRIQHVELRELAHPRVDNLLTGFPAPALKEAIDQVVAADGVIAVTPIFTASYNALFKAFFDVLDRETLVGMPVLIAATGGTERHSLALEHAIRPLFGYLRAHVVPTAVYAASSDFGGRSGDTAGLAERIERAAGEFATLITVLDRPGRADTDVQLIPFERLLAG
jgi:FMN reductase